MRARRDPYAAAGTAHRAALERAVAMNEHLRPRDWRVLAACFAITASYSLIEATTTVGQLSGLSGVSLAQTSKSLSRLNTAGVITWRPTRTRGATGASKLSLVGGSPDLARLTITSKRPPKGEEACPF